MHRVVVIDEQIDTDDVGVAERLVGDVYGRTRITADGGPPFRFRRTVHGDERVSLARFELSSPASIAVEYGAVVGIGGIMRGRYRATADGVDIDPSRPFVLQHGLVRSESDDLAVSMVNLDQHALEGIAGFSAGSLRVAGIAPVSTAAQESWTRVLRFADAMLTGPDGAADLLIRRSVLDLLAATALTAFAVDGRPVGGRSGPAPRSVRRAVEFIEEHAAEPIGVVEIAGAAGLGVRALHSAFRRALDTTPAALLREVRLERIRRELQAADPVDTSVGEVARRWGFAHLGRFAGTYRARYDELPSETLRA